MDPDATLAEIDRLLVLVPLAILAADGQEIVESALSLAERVNALHDWMANGGFLPKAWQRNDMTTKENRNED